jgi:hypothetical protein
MADDRDGGEELTSDDQPRRTLPAWASIIRSSNTRRTPPVPAADRVRVNQAPGHRFDRPR